MRIVPYGQHVLVEQDPAETVTPGGIILPDVSVRHQRKATVLAAGAGHYEQDGTYVPMDVAPGDRVCCRDLAGDEFILNDGRRVLILRQRDVLARIVDA